MLDLNEYAKLLVGLLAVINPITNVPAFLGLTDQMTPAERRRIALISSLAVALVLLAFLGLGESILSVFGISIASFRIAGGLLLLLAALSMMGGKESSQPKAAPRSESPISIALVPLAIPLLAGPGAISAVIVFAARSNSVQHYFLIAAVIVVISLLIYLAFRLAPTIAQFLGKTGMTVISRVMGLALAAIGIEFMAQGLLSLFPGLSS